MDATLIERFKAAAGPSGWLEAEGVGTSSGKESTRPVCSSIATRHSCMPPERSLTK